MIIFPTVFPTSRLILGVLSGKSREKVNLENLYNQWVLVGQSKFWEVN
jgi:hypothetical protein